MIHDKNQLSFIRYVAIKWLRLCLHITLLCLCMFNAILSGFYRQCKVYINTSSY